MATPNAEPSRTQRAAAIRKEPARKARTQRVAMVTRIVPALAVTVATAVRLARGGNTPATVAPQAEGDGGVHVAANRLAVHPRQSLYRPDALIPQP